MLVGLEEKDIINQLFLCYTVLCCIIMVHTGIRAVLTGRSTGCKPLVFKLCNSTTISFKCMMMILMTMIFTGVKKAKAKSDGK